jgi:AraC-like DNA-binding protein
MGVVFYTGKTRVYLMRSAAARDGRPREPSVTAIVPDDGGEENRALLRVLEGREPGAAAGRYERNAFECLLIAVRDLLARPPETGAPGKARYTWEAACDFLVENLHRPVSRKDVARHLGVHPNHLSRLFAEFGSGTFSEFIQARRLDRARLLMADPRLNFAEVARLSGFSSANYFTRVFRAQTGRTPTRARSAGRPAQSRQASPK